MNGSFYVKSWLFFLLVCISFNGFSQSYHPLPYANAVWRVNYFNQDECPGQLVIPYQAYQYSLEGDTEFNGLKYVKVYQSIIQQCFNYLTSFSYLRGGIRQDTVSRKVFFTNFTNDITDTLLYNFDLHPGDTLQQTYINIGHYYVVESVDSLLLGDGIFHRRFHISSLQRELVEGIGNTSTGLLEPFELPTIAASWSFVCFSTEGSILYGDTANCTINNGTSEVKKDEKDFSYIISDHLLIFKLLNQQTPIKVNVYNSLGESLIQYTFHDELQQYRIPLQYLNDGVYIYKVETPSKIFAEVFILKD